MTDFAPTRLTAADFWQLPETNSLRELIDGEIFMPGSPSDNHQATVMETAAYLKALVQVGKIRVAPLDVYLDDENIPQPDIFWAGRTTSHCQLNADGKWVGAPDLIVEVLSPSTAYVDRGKKFLLYERFGVLEYWIIDPIARFVEVYTLVEQHYVRQGIYNHQETFSSLVLQATIEAQQFFE